MWIGNIIFVVIIIILISLEAVLRNQLFITFILFQELSLSFGFNINWYSSNLFPNAFPRI